MINTPHINPTAEIAETVILPGDPLRARFISENFLENSVQFNAVRGALGYTGEYEGKKVSVMGTGMGMPSMGIYSHELINIYKAKNLIRIGTCGAIQEDIKLYDVVMAMGACTNSNFAAQFDLRGSFSAIADFGLLSKAKAIADSKNIKSHIGNILTSDTFYCDDMHINDRWRKMGVLAVEMETAALYMNAARYGAKALAIYTVSDNMITKEETSAAQRETAFTDMMKIALKLA